MPYAEDTSVPVVKTRIEIEGLLVKHKASHIGVMLQPGRAQIAFTIQGWSVLFRIPLPTEQDTMEWKDPRHSWRSMSEAAKAAKLEQICRSRWRALLLTLKAKLVSVESKVETLEEAFMAHLVVDRSGETMGDRSLPELRDALVKGKLQRLELGAGEARP